MEEIEISFKVEAVTQWLIRHSKREEGYQITQINLTLSLQYMP